MRGNAKVVRSHRVGWMFVVVWGIGYGSLINADAEEKRYSAELADGTRIAAEKFQDWNDTKQTPKLNGQAVFDENNPIRWVIDHSLSPPAQPEAFVEFFGGDRLPGEVAGFRSGRESPFLTRPEHLIVHPSLPLHSPKLSGSSAVRVRTRWLKRVVWQPRPLDLYQPGTVFLKDGREIGFRSLRWDSGSITLLLEEGIEEFRFDEVLEIHFPLPDVWAFYSEQMAVLSPQSGFKTEDPARIVQLETTDGLKVTASTERMQPFMHGDRNKSESWHHQCQPAWSLDPFWVRFDSVWTRRFFWPHEVPLTSIAPVSVRQESPLGESWYWQRDRNVYRQPLQSGGQHFGWGFGVHAFHEAVFPLPSAARGFRTQAGLDQSVGDGGSVRWKVAVRASSEKTLHESPVVVGTNKVRKTGNLKLGTAGDDSPDRRLVLSVDPLLKGAPAGADPLDVRDSLNWLQPEVLLDPKELKQDIARHALSQVPALADWEREAPDQAAVILRNHWDDDDKDDPRYRVLLGTQGRFLSLTKSLTIGPEDRWLILAVHRPDEKTPPVRLQVHIDGRAVAEMEIPAARDDKGPDPLLVPVSAYREQSVDVRLVQFPVPISSDPLNEEETLAACVDWRGISTSAHRPGLLPVLPENAKALEWLTEGDGQLGLDKTEPFSGKKSFQLTPPERSAARIPGLAVPIRADPRLGEYRYLSFAWKQAEGKDIALGLAHQGVLGGEEFGKARPRVRRDAQPARAVRARRPLRAAGRGLQHGYRYRQGPGGDELGPALKVDGKRPEDWQRIQRDVFADFGEFDLTGLSLRCPEGSAAWFDEIYLARDKRDFEHLPSRKRQKEPPQDENILKIETQPERFGIITQKVAPQFAVSDTEDVQILKEHQGNQNVLRTHPRDQKTPGVLRAAVILPKDQKSRLELEVHRHPEGDWNLVVTANGEKLHETLINQDNADEEWFQTQVDLSRYAGQAVILEVQNAANNWQNEAGFWKRAAIVHEEK